MKKTTTIAILLLAMLATACGSASNRTRSATGSPGGPSSPSAGELPATTQLILGTLKLEGTAQVVTAKQAAELLPLWQTMKVLSESDTAAQQEKDALIAQIQETMTAGQMQAIEDMKLSRADMASLMQEQGRAAGNSPTGGQNRSSSSNNGRNSGRGGGFFPGGPPPDGGFGGGFGGQGQNLSKEQIATAQAARQANANSISPMLLNAVIEYLQKKTGA